MTAWLASRWPRLAWLASARTGHALVLVLAVISLVDVWLAAYLVSRSVGGP